MRVLLAADVAAAVFNGFAMTAFMALPHPEVRDMYQRKGADHGRWISGMRRYRRAPQPD